jgi:WhiB family transcriptional regulator, redox-sensing transcriptional regulator
VTTALYTVPLARSKPVPALILDSAACKDQGDLFFIDSKGAAANAEAREICASCPVRQQCLDYALPIAGLMGVWGGLDPQQRGIERRKRGYVDSYHEPKPQSDRASSTRTIRPVQPQQGCPSEAQYRRHRRAGEDCPECRRFVSDANTRRRRRRGGR